MESYFRKTWPKSHPHHDKISKGTEHSLTTGRNAQILYTTHYSSRPMTTTFELICGSLCTTSLTLDFDGTLNMRCIPSDELRDNSSDLKIVAMNLRPFQRIYLGYLEVIDTSEASSYKTNYIWEYNDPHPDDWILCFGANTIVTSSSSSKYALLPKGWPSTHPHFNEILRGTETETQGRDLILFHTSHYDDPPYTLTFEAISLSLTTMTLTLDFQGTENMNLIPADDFQASSSFLKVSAMFRPFQRIYLGYLQVVDPYAKSTSKFEYSWNYAAAHPDDLAKCLPSQNLRDSQAINEVKDDIDHSIISEDNQKSSLEDKPDQQIPIDKIWPKSHPHYDKIAKGREESSSGSDVTVFYTYHYDDIPTTRTIEAICNTMRTAHVTMDFSNSTNTKFIPAEEFQSKSTDKLLVASFRPFRRVYLGYSRVIDENASCSFSAQSTWTYDDPHPDDVAKAQKETKDVMYQELQALKASNICSHSLHSLDEDPLSELLLNKLLASNNLQFIDFDFFPDDNALRTRKTKAGTGNKMPEINVQWKRPKQFLKDLDDIRVFLKTISAHEIQQGQLGDCWFLSAVTAVARFPDLIMNLFVEDLARQRKSAVSLVGLYHLRFYRDGLETIVRVDDYIPCQVGPMGDPKYGPLFSHSNGCELWVMLLEKAFAKLHGSYGAIEGKVFGGGMTAEALNILTGAPSKSMRFEDDDIQSKIKSGEFWKILQSYDEVNYLLTTSVGTEAGQNENLEKELGLVSDHAYSLLACVEVNGVRLCRLRNPWGNTEWLGDWSDNSPLWTVEMKNALREVLMKRSNLQQQQLPTRSLAIVRSVASVANHDEILKIDNKEDGLFWMSYNDFLKYYCQVTVCFLRHPNYTRLPWQVERKPFCFTFDSLTPAGGVTHSSNQWEVPWIYQCFRLEVIVPKADFIFTLYEQTFDPRDSTASKDSRIDKSFAILRAIPRRPASASTAARRAVAGKYDYEKVLDDGFRWQRQPNQSEVINLTTGLYIIVCMTTAAKGLHFTALAEMNRNEKREEVSKVPLTLQAGEDIVLSKQSIGAYKELFKHLDVNSDGYLDKLELGFFYELVNDGKTVDDQTYNSLLGQYGNLNRLGLSLSGFLALQRNRFQKDLRCNDALLTKELRTLGFDQKLQYTLGRSMTLTVHGTEGIADPALHLSNNQSVSASVSRPVSSECDRETFRLNAIPRDQNLSVIELLSALGNCTTYEDDRIKIYAYYPGYQSFLVMVENSHSLPLEIEIDCSDCTNVISHRGSLIHREVVYPSEKVIFHRLTANNCTKDFTCAYGITYAWNT